MGNRESHTSRNDHYSRYNYLKYNRIDEGYRERNKDKAKETYKLDKNIAKEVYKSDKDTKPIISHK